MTSPCSMNATCKNTVGSHSCMCKDGFTGNGINCTGKDCKVYHYQCIIFITTIHDYWVHFNIQHPN